MHRTALLLSLLLLLPACSQDELPASAFVMQTRDQRIGGPASDTDVGDIALENGEIRVGILGARCEGTGQWQSQCSSPAPGLFSGSMVDIDLNRRDSRTDQGEGREAFAELFSSVNLDVTATRSVSILADGSDGGPAIVRTEGPAGNYISYIELLGSLLDLPRTWQTTDFILKPGDRYLTLRTHAVVTTTETLEEGVELVDPDVDPCGGWAQGDEGLPCDESLLLPVQEELPLIDGINNQGIQMGDFFFAGGDVDIFVPGIGFDEDIHVNQFFLDGGNSFSQPFTFPFVAATGNGVSYAFGTGGVLSAPLFTSSLTAVFGAGVVPEVVGGEIVPFEPGTQVGYERFLAVGQGDVASALDALFDAFEAHGSAIELGSVRGRVLEETSMAPQSGLHVLVYQDFGEARDGDGLPPEVNLYSQFETDVGQDAVLDGSFSGRLPAGDYVFVAKDHGRTVSTPVNVTVHKAQTTEVGLVVPRAGEFVIEVVDERGRALPSKVSLRPRGATPTNRTELGDPFYAGGFSHVSFLGHGHGTVEVPPGRYDLVVSRGPEYSLWDSATDGGAEGGLEVAAGGRVEIAAVLTREVDSTGFVAADLHVHSAPSHDSGVSLELRTITMAAEGVEYFVATDHDVITEFGPVVEALGLDPWVQASAGLETTTIEIGHFLGWPLTTDYTQPSHHGAVDWTGATPTEIIDGIRELGAYGPEETAVYVGHPRDGILGYFDQYGLVPFEGSLNSPRLEASLLNLRNPLLTNPDATFSTDYDGLELLNGKRFDLIRTPTHREMTCFAAFEDGVSVDGCDGPVTMSDIVRRTAEEQQALLDGELFISDELEGQVDDWFTLLNLGFRYTVLGNSDTHGLTKTESGCPRNYIVSAVDEPELIDEREMARAVREHRVVASYGPLIRFWADDISHGVGSDVTVDDGTVTLSIEVQAPRWMNIDRVELHENGVLIREWTGDAISTDGVIKFDELVEVPAPMITSPLGVEAPGDAWYVVSVMGEQDLSPIYQPVEVPPLQLNDIVVGALGELDLGPIAGAVGAPARFPKTHPVYPYAITNPIWVDFTGDGQFQPTGAPPDGFAPPPE